MAKSCSTYYVIDGTYYRRCQTYVTTTWYEQDKASATELVVTGPVALAALNAAAIPANERVGDLF